MASPSFNALTSVRLTAAVEALQDARQIPQELKFLARTPITPAIDGEILARFIAYLVISDLVADDQAATVYSTGKIQFESTNIPNIKHGVNVNQSMLNLLQAIQNGTALGADIGLFDNYLNQQMDDILIGIRERMEQMIISMQLDSFSYDRFGIKLTNATWGMPADLKVTSSITWDNTTATPVSDIRTILRYARIRYGKVYHRITMSMAAFNYMVATTEFQTQAKFFLPAGLTAASLPIQSMDMMQTIAKSVLGLEIEFYDARYWQQSTLGAFASAPFFPITQVLFSDPADDNRPMVMDWGSGIVTESLVGSLANTAVIGGIPGPQRGPIAYATVPPDLNPPNVTLWGVARGFPRKKQLQATAVLTVGVFTDPIPTTAPF